MRGTEKMTRSAGPRFWVRPFAVLVILAYVLLSPLNMLLWLFGFDMPNQWFARFIHWVEEEGVINQ